MARSQLENISHEERSIGQGGGDTVYVNFDEIDADNVKDPLNHFEF